MLAGFVILYLLVSIGIGLFAATRVHNAKDYAVAGRCLPFPIVTAMVFATWFGSEAVLGIPASFIKDGFAGIIEDPFGSFGCLMLVGVLFARPLYRMNLLTIGDFYRHRYGRWVELFISISIIVSYLGWVAAQLTALGLVFNVLSHGAIPTNVGLLIGAIIVLIYTLFGGMWSVALTDFFQMSIIVGGLIYLTWLIGDMAGGPSNVLAHAASQGKFEFIHGYTPKHIVDFFAAMVTMMLGSIPQQDVFQRVMSAKSEKVAVRGSIAGACCYLVFCMLPLFLTFAATIIDPQMVNGWLEKDAQMILPHLILERTPLFAQIMFFGALLSAIMSTASGTLLAPSITFTENILKHFMPRMSDRQFLRVMRLTVVCAAIVTTIFAYYSDASIYEMVGNAYKVTLVSAVVPLFAGMFWKRSTTQGAMVSIVFGVLTWVLCELTHTDASFWPPQLAGLLMGAVGMLVGSLLPQRFGVGEGKPISV